MVSMYTNRNCRLTNVKLFHSVCVYKVLISLVKFEDFAVLRFNAACIDNFQRFGLARQSHLLGLLDP
jgi:hypothetical protein